jgi:hypothetical protein
MARGTWKINIGSSDLATYDDVVTPMESDGGPVVQTERLFRAENMKHYERAGFAKSMTLQVVKEFTTNKLATDFWLHCEQTWNGVKDVVLTHQDHTGTETAYTIAGASVRVRCGAPIGVTNIVTVSIVGKKVA